MSPGCHVAALLALTAMWSTPTSDAHGLRQNSSSLQEHFDELVGLSELSMHRLLAVKKSLRPDPEEDAMVAAADDGDGHVGRPEAQALRGGAQSRGGGDHHDAWDAASTKSSTITSIFSTTITALAFIAFAAYLICMIIVAVQNTNNGGQPTMFVQGAAAPQIVQGRRRRREVGGGGGGEGWVGVDHAGMYRALVMLAEGYAVYHKAHARRGF